MDVEVVIDGDEDESDEDEEDETDDTEDEDGEDIEIIDDGIDDDGNDSLDDGNEDEWQDEVEDGQEMEHESEELNHARGSVVRELMTMQNIGAGLAAFDGLEAGEFGALDMGLAPGLLPGRVGLDAGREWFAMVSFEPMVA